MGFLGNLFGNPNKKVIEKLQPLVVKINSQEEEIKKLSDSEIKKRSLLLKEKVFDSFNKRKKEWLKLDKEDAQQKRKEIEQEILESVLPEAFSLVREAASRVIKMRHFDVQLLGALVLNQGKISEMKTGEGKTLVATLAAYLNALTGRGVHIVTVNDYLAKRDTGWMGQVYDFLGLKVGCVTQENSYILQKDFIDENAQDEKLQHLRITDKKEAYQADITYGTNNEFGFDYLRDNMVSDISQMNQREHHYAIIDEVDSILIDEARTPLIISAPAEKSADLYQKFARLVPNLKENEHYQVDEKAKAVILNDKGIEKMEQLLGVKNIYEEGGVQLAHHLDQALKAQALFKKDRDYVVNDGEVVIVDEFTGRLMQGRRYSEGLHQAIEAKEGVEIKRESRTMATVTFQNYFRMYEKISGMTGTAATEAEEFHRIYSLDVVTIPTNKENIRKDLADLIYKTEKAKFQAVVEDIKECQKNGQPVLVGTVSVEKNESLSGLLTRNGVKHEVLNAKNHEREAHIIAQAGKPGSVTVATNMAGRGVDIILGGNPPEKNDAEKVKKAGGLKVIGTERHESRRIDNQLRGRAGRQGDAGVSRFYVSLEDDLMRIFGSDRVKGMMDALGLPDDQPIENNILSRALESAQKKVEGHNFDIRKHLLEYDDVINKHRESIYRRRRRVLEAENLKEEMMEILSSEVASLVNIHLNPELDKENGSSEDPVGQISQGLRGLFPQEIKIPKLPKAPSEMIDVISHFIMDEYEKKEKEIGQDQMRFLEKAVYLRVIDTWWIEHLEAIDSLKEGIGLRGYGQREPLVEFKKEAYGLYEQLIAGIERDVANTIFKVQLIKTPQENTQMKAQKEELKTPVTEGKKYSENPQAVQQGSKVGRNDPCPCGAVDPNTGRPKKFKKCCGKNT